MQASGPKSENPILISADDHVLGLIILVWSPQGSDFFSFCWFGLFFFNLSSFKRCQPDLHP